MRQGSWISTGRRDLERVLLKSLEGFSSVQWQVQRKEIIMAAATRRTERLQISVTGLVGKQEDDGGDLWMGKSSRNFTSSAARSPSLRDNFWRAFFAKPLTADLRVSISTGRTP